MATSAQTKATTKYIKDHTRTYVFRCNNDGDADLIAWLESRPNVAGYIKSLVRADMEASERKSN